MAKKKLSTAFHFYTTYYIVLKKQNIPQDAAWKALEFAKNNYQKMKYEKNEFLFYQKNMPFRTVEIWSLKILSISKTKSAIIK
jgi:hypothetical protein